MIKSDATYLYVDTDLNQYYVQGKELTDLNIWDGSTTYQRLDAIEYQGALYVALATNTGETPVDLNEFWSSLVVIYGATTVVTAGSDYLARLAAAQAMITAQIGTQTAYFVLGETWSGTAALQALSADVIHDGFGSVKAHHIDFGYGTDQVWAGSIPYTNGAFTTVAQVLDTLLYVPVNLNSFTNSVNSVEIGGTVASATLTWSFNKTLTLLTLTDAGTLPVVQTTYPATGPWTSNKTWSIYGTDGSTADNGNTSITFYFSRYWGTSANASATDGDILALSSELSTTRVQSRTITAANAYVYFAYPAAWGLASFTVNGLLNTAWTLVTRTFVNASGYSASYNIYRSDNLLTGTYQIALS